MNGNVIELGLALRQSQPTQGTALRILLGRSLVVLQEWLSAFGDPDRADLSAGLDDCQAALAADAPVGELEALLLPSLDAGTSIIAQLKLKHIESRNEMSTLISIVRDAVSAVTVENKNLHVSLNQSTARFAAVVQFNDIQQIKSQIVAEVSLLKRVIAERQSAWESNTGLLSDRVAVLERQLQTSRDEASLDPLTRIANRRTFDHTLREWMRPGQPGFVLAVLDIDRFKSINDEQGHAQGDRALVALAQTLKGSVRSRDLAARLGGDEFALLISGLPLRQAEFRLKTIGSALSAREFPGIADSSFTLTVSTGVAEFSAGDTAGSLIHRADEALYQAKHLGKNRVVTRESACLADLMKGR